MGEKSTGNSLGLPAIDNAGKEFNYLMDTPYFGTPNALLATGNCFSRTGS